MAGVWTRNYSNGLVTNLGSAGTAPSSYAPAYANGTIAVRTVSGSWTQMGVGSGYIITDNITKLPALPSLSYGASINSGTNIQFGTGDTAPAFDDYCLEAPVGNFTISQSNVQVEKYHWNATDKQYSTTYRYVVQYTGTAEITIKEMGIFMVGCLLYHEVFDTPITLNQYESVVIELTQAFPIINYEPYPT